MRFTGEIGELPEKMDCRSGLEESFSKESLDKYEKLLGDEGQDEQSDTHNLKDLETEFEENIEVFAKEYADVVNSNRPWSWNEDIVGGEELTSGQRRAIREYAREHGLVPEVPTYEKDGKTYADFSNFSVFECSLEKENWGKTDKEQFDLCNQKLKNEVTDAPEMGKLFSEDQLEQINEGTTPSGYTWHHSEKDGIMQLVPYGVHNSTNHCGGRSEGNWADSPRY